MWHHETTYSEMDNAGGDDKSSEKLAACWRSMQIAVERS
jgi:hypothetical protein